MTFYKQYAELKNTKILIAKYYLYGLISIIFFYAIIGEIPRLYAIERDWIEWTSSIIAIPIIGIFISKYLNKKIAENKQKYYAISFFALFTSWIFLLYFKSLVVGIISSLEFGNFRILDSLIGYSIYQLWIYGIFGIIHGIVGGYFLSKELKNKK